METSKRQRGRHERPANVEPVDRTVAVVLAGGKGTRLDPLTRTICKPALPFGGTYRCIDFSLSNCVNSGLRAIGVATQHKPDALLDHLWTHWNSAAVGDDVVIHAWRGEERAERDGLCGTADAVYRNLASIGCRQGSLALVLAGDHVYKMDYRPMLEAHCAANAAVTIGCIEAPVDDARRYGILAVRDDGRVDHFVEKPRHLGEVLTASGDHMLASMGIYVFDAALLAHILPLDAAQCASGHDLAADILPSIIERHGGQAYVFRGENAGSAYWRDVGTLDAYWRAHMELLGPAPLLTLDDPCWPIGRGAAKPCLVTREITTPAGGTIEDSIVPKESRIAGRVAQSVLFEGTAVERGAEILETVVLPGAVVAAGSRLRGVIVDAGCRVPAGTVIERCEGIGEPPVISTQRVETFPFANTRMALNQCPRSPANG